MSVEFGLMGSPSPHHPITLLLKGLRNAYF